MNRVTIVRTSLSTYVLATRPAFLTITLLACGIGFAVSSYNRHPAIFTLGALATILALLGHAGANLINDYYDSLNGSDAANNDRIYPYTGGSRYIQEGLLTEARIKHLAAALFLAMTGGGLILCYLSTWYLLPAGFFGALFGWGYSASPLKLMARGIWGQIAVTACVGLVVTGAATIGDRSWSAAGLSAGLIFGLQGATVLFVNQIPDRTADRAAGKMTLAVQADPENLWAWYCVFPFGSHLALCTAVVAGTFPAIALFALTSAPLYAWCAVVLYRLRFDKITMERAIKLTIVATHMSGLILLAVLLVARG
jgi:1,4-dihydroxy-2-naphthoate polyprenyltransferase